MNKDLEIFCDTRKDLFKLKEKTLVILDRIMGAYFLDAHLHVLVMNLKMVIENIEKAYTQYTIIEDLIQSLYEEEITRVNELSEKK